MKIVNISHKGVALIKKWEGFREQAYICPAGVPTIGYGSTRYEDGRKVQMKDQPISEVRAEMLLYNTLKQFEREVDAMTRDDINQNQFDALVSFAYNLGGHALKSSTLLKLINLNPTNPDIRLQFGRWVYGDGKRLPGLVSRRKDEADLYFS